MLIYQLMMDLLCKLKLICGPIRQEDRQSLHPVTKYPETFPLEKIKSRCTDTVIVMGRHTDGRILQLRVRDGLRFKVNGGSIQGSLTAGDLRGPQITRPKCAYVLGSFLGRYKHWVHK